MEIEKKYTIKKLPENLETYPCKIIEQAYLNTAPVVRIRRSNDEYYLTYKGSGLMAREEYNLPLTREAYTHLIEKADGHLITKDRYVIPLDGGLNIELDFFSGYLDGMIFAEVEFPDEAAANSFQPPSWFGEDVTCSPQYQNSTLSRL